MCRERPKQDTAVYFYVDRCCFGEIRGWGVSDYLEMNLEQLQKEHAKLLAFNENLDRERNGYRKDACKYAKKVQMIASLFVVPSDDHELTIKAIKTIVKQVGES